MIRRRNAAPAHRRCGVVACVALLLLASAQEAFAQHGSVQGPVQGPVREYLSLEQLRARYGASGGRIANIAGVDVYYRDEGRGPAILMVHGSVSSLRTWDGVATRLRHRHRIIRYDIPPQGLSGPVSDEAAARLAPVDIAEGLLAHLNITRATVVGVSSGGTLGVFLAAKRPDLVERLILANMPSDPVPTDPPVSPALKAAMAEERATGFRSMRFWDAFLDFYAGDPSRISRERRIQYYDMNRRSPEPNLLSLVARVRDQEKAREAMAAVRAPTLLVWGGADALLPVSAAATLESRLTHAQVSKVILPDVGHYPPLEAPERFAAILAAYIDAATPSRSRLQ